MKWVTWEQVGVDRMASPDDRVALERGRLVYEALYAQFASEPTQGINR